MLADFPIVFRWWGTLFLVGAVAFPITKKLFANWWDRGYLFSKAVGMALITFLVYVAGTIHLFPFSVLSILWAMVVVLIVGLGVNGIHIQKKGISKRNVIVIVIEELFFFAALLFWAWVKGHEPSIHGLEKFMDFGFTKSILDNSYFPTPDLWYAGFTINYYYFGHTVMAMLTKLSGLDLAYTFNLMLASLFAFTFTMSFSIAYQLLRLGLPARIGRDGRAFGALFTAYLVTLAGNMQTIYAFTKGYFGDVTPPPFWTLLWKPSELGNIGQGLDRYWYANATRFIPLTIHEFPSYSFVVSDVHGHVLSLPFVLLAIGLLIAMFGAVQGNKKHQSFISTYQLLFYGFLCGVLFMTNASDGPIYLGLFVIFYVLQDLSLFRTPIAWIKKHWMHIAFVAVAGPVLLPFLLHFHSFVAGLAVNCPPAILANHKIGPILFEGVEKCQHSPIWMMWLLWGFFIYCGLYFILSKLKRVKSKTFFTQFDRLLIVFFVFSLLLIIFPEFFYFKDIYPTYFRSNTMFKLGYQAFIMFSIVSGYTIVQAFVRLRTRMLNMLFLIILIPQLFLVSIYPIFSVRSYFNSLRQYQGLYGLTWLKSQYPDNFEGIQFLNKQVAAMNPQIPRPVIVEADGDSYTDYDQFSAFTGLQTVVGWAVHEWLWRGTYDLVAPRRADVQTIYESTDIAATRALLQRYNVTYIIVGPLEVEKYPHMDEEKFGLFGKLVFFQGTTKIYKLP